MGRLMAAMYDRMMRQTEEACLEEWRAEILADLTGAVLEVGAGTGLNLRHYPAAVSRLVLTEPDPYMRRRLVSKARRAGRTGVEVVECSLDRLEVPDAAFDAVVGTLVLCSVRRLETALAEIRRVLKPGGRFVFLEHVAAEGRPRRLRWQRRLEPIWKWATGNCHLTRRTGDALQEAGFSITSMRKESMRKALPVVRPTIRGTAIKPLPATVATNQEG